jgi:hypothetical protein
MATLQITATAERAHLFHAWVDGRETEYGDGRDEEAEKVERL